MSTPLAEIDITSPLISHNFLQFNLDFELES